MNDYIIVTANYPPHIGGAERYSEAIACELARRGNNVYIITSQYDNLTPEERLSEHLIVFRAPSRMLLDGRMPVLIKSEIWKKLRRTIQKRNKPRVIIQTFLYPLSYAFSRISRKEGWNYIVINHGCNYVCSGRKLSDRLEHIYEEVMARATIWGSIGCFSVSVEAEKWTSHFTRRTAGILYNGIDVEETARKIKTLPMGIRKKHGINTNSIVIAFVGRMIREKGIFQLIEASLDLLNEGSDIVLLAVGGGEELERIKEYQSERIIFTDSISHDEVIRTLRESDICCLPSDSEGLPTVLLEAALADCLLISSPYGGSKEVIDEYGIIMKDNSRESIYSAIKSAICLGNKEYILKRSKERVKKLFSWHNTCDCIERIKWYKDGKIN